MNSYSSDIKQIIGHAFTCVELGEHSFFAGGRENVYNHYGNLFVGSSGNSTLNYFMFLLCSFWAYTHRTLHPTTKTHAHFSFILNGQKMEMA